MDLLLIAFHCGDEERTGKEGCTHRAEAERRTCWRLNFDGRGALSGENSGVSRLPPDALGRTIPDV